MQKYRKAINDIVRYWRNEGDDAPASELWLDAIKNLRWRIETGKSINQS